MSTYFLLVTHFGQPGSHIKIIIQIKCINKYIQVAQWGLNVNFGHNQNCGNHSVVHPLLHEVFVHIYHSLQLEATEQNSHLYSRVNWGDVV